MNIAVLLAVAVPALFLVLVAVLFGVVWFAGRSGRRAQVRRFGRTAA